MSTRQERVNANLAAFRARRKALGDRQVGVVLPGETFERLQALAAVYGSQNAAVSAAINELWAKFSKIV